MVYNGRVYLTPPMTKTATWFTMNEWRCYPPLTWSTGLITALLALHRLRVGPWRRGAGQCIERDGKFYFYVPISKKGGWNAVELL